MQPAMSVARLAVLAAALAALLTIAPAAAHASRPCAHADTRATRAPRREMQSAVLCLVNKQRAAHHLPALHGSSLLNRSAQGWTNVMVASDTFSHGSDFAARISAVGFNWASAGENIASGFPTPRAVVNAWMRSPDHCRNILSPVYREVGTGVSPHPVRGAASGSATWTQDFALPMAQSPPSGNYGPADGCPY